MATFTESDLALTQKFIEAMSLKFEVKLDNTSEKDDTLNLGEYLIVLDEKGLMQLYRVVSHYSWEYGPEQSEHHMGEYYKLSFALNAIMHDMCDQGLEVFWERIMAGEEYES
jgi:hypothetical protein